MSQGSARSSSPKKRSTSAARTTIQSRPMGMHPSAQAAVQRAAKRELNLRGAAYDRFIDTALAMQVADRVEMPAGTVEIAPRSFAESPAAPAAPAADTVQHAETSLKRWADAVIAATPLPADAEGNAQHWRPARDSKILIPQNVDPKTSREIYSLEDVEKALTLAKDLREATLLKRTLQSMQSVGGRRDLAKPTGTGMLDELEIDCPNFAAVLSDLKNNLELAMLSGQPMCFPPILLAGDPGVGKTYFTKRLAKALATEFCYISVGGVTGSFVISGSAPGWQAARHGRIAQQLIEGSTANPLVMLDEIDKPTVGNYDPVGTYLQLTEAETAQHFKDEFLDVTFDCSRILWVGTANDVGDIRKSLLSRFTEYQIPAPTTAQAAGIAQRVYSGILAEFNVPFDAELSEGVLEIVATVAPREMKKCLVNSMGATARAGRSHIQPGDISQAHLAKRQKVIGFA